jgi:predicted TIM-barrel fold metal-dependent hydrolase
MILDGHVHMGSVGEETALLRIREATGIDRMVLVSIQDPEGGSGLPQSLYMKARHPERFYVFAGLNHAARLSEGRVSTPALADQVDEFVAIGCDGIKMIEGKPTSRKRLDIPVTDAYYADYWARAEELRLPIVWHVGDPEEFWDPAETPAWAKERNWGYGPRDVPKEALYAEVDQVLARYPGLRIIFAHFFFLSADLDRARQFLEDHPNVCFDLAPGIEMLHNISRDPAAGSAFFTEYSDRIVFGTDLSSGMTQEQGQIRAGIVSRWLESDDTFRVPDQADFLLGRPEDGEIRGMALPPATLASICCGNLVGLVGPRPASLDPGKAIETCERIAAIAEALSGRPAAETEAARAARLLAARNHSGSS